MLSVQYVRAHRRLNCKECCRLLILAGMRDESRSNLGYSINRPALVGLSRFRGDYLPIRSPRVLQGSAQWSAQRMPWEWWPKKSESAASPSGPTLVPPTDTAHVPERCPQGACPALLPSRGALLTINDLTINRIYRNFSSKNSPKFNGKNFR